MPLKRKKAKKKAVKKIRRKVTKRKVLKRRSTAKKVAAKKPAARKLPKEEGQLVGAVTHYFPHVQAAVIKVKSPLALGDTIKIKGHTTDLTQTISSMQIDRTPINQAKKGDEIGLLVESRVRQHDKVYKI
jgi:hypothetical protein